MAASARLSRSNHLAARVSVSRMTSLVGAAPAAGPVAAGPARRARTKKSRSEEPAYFINIDCRRLPSSGAFLRTAAQAASSTSLANFFSSSGENPTAFTPVFSSSA